MNNYLNAKIIQLENRIRDLENSKNDVSDSIETRHRNALRQEQNYLSLSDLEKKGKV